MMYCFKCKSKTEHRQFGPFIECVKCDLTGDEALDAASYSHPQIELTKLESDILIHRLDAGDALWHQYCDSNLDVFEKTEEMPQGFFELLMDLSEQVRKRHVDIQSFGEGLIEMAKMLLVECLEGSTVFVIEEENSRTYDDKYDSRRRRYNRIVNAGKTLATKLAPINNGECPDVPLH